MQKKIKFPMLFHCLFRSRTFIHCASLLRCWRIFFGINFMAATAQQESIGWLYYIISLSFWFEWRNHADPAARYTGTPGQYAPGPGYAGANINVSSELCLRTFSHVRQDYAAHNWSYYHEGTNWIVTFWEALSWAEAILSSPPPPTAISPLLLTSSRQEQAVF